MELATIFPSKYLKAADLQNHEVTVKISRAEIEKMGEDQKLVLYFEGKQKGLVTNRTNADRIAHLFGSNTDDWIGKSIVLYPDMVNFQGRAVEALRVRAHTPAPKPTMTPSHPPQRPIGGISDNHPALDPDLNDKIPF